MNKDKPSKVLTNQALAILFPAFGGIIVAFAVALFQISGSLYRLWSWMFTLGIPFKWIVSLNILMTSVIWLRTFFLMPIGWLKRNTNVYHSSPVHHRFKILQITRLESAQIHQLEKEQVGDRYRDNALSVEFILCVIFISFTNLDNMFCALTWGQYTRSVDVQEYKSLVNAYGVYAWMGAVFSVSMGFIIDFISLKLSKIGLSNILINY